MHKAIRIVGICFFIYTAIIVVLCLIWYKGIFKGSFNFFDDSLEWLQMDKAGHFFTSFHISRWFIQILEWQKIEKNKAVAIGVWGGMIFVSPIEVLDGFSQAYGFSWTDLLANFCGCLFLYFQVKFFGRIKFLPKFSFQISPFAVMRKEMLGSYLLSSVIKDYNGQTYWISFSPNVFLKKQFFPRWLLISVGYGVNNLLGGHDNVWNNGDEVFDFSHLVRSRECYFSFDISLQHLKFENSFLKFVRLACSCLKFPFPAIGYNEEKGLVFKLIGI